LFEKNNKKKTVIKEDKSNEKEEFIGSQSVKNTHGFANDFDTMKLFGAGLLALIVFGLIYAYFARNKGKKQSNLGDASNYGTLHA
jgi:hypothetical protein